MIGKDFYRIDKNSDISNERFKSLIFFYGPMIKNDALVLYQNLIFQEEKTGFDELNELLVSLNMSVSEFENLCEVLNEYGLLQTLNKDNKYIFRLNAPLSMNEFVNDDILVRQFILKTSGPFFQNLVSRLNINQESYNDFLDVTKSLDTSELNVWTKDDETFLNIKRNDDYNFNTLFDVNKFLKDVSTNLLPMRFRTKENLYNMAKLADLYSISYDKMRTFLPKVANTETNVFDLSILRYLCMKAKVDYTKVEENEYNVPCQTYLMSIQDGKELTDYDKKIIYNLSNKYHLNIPVINVLLAHGLKNCDNRLIENYLYPIASDLYRNDIKSAEKALERLSRNYNKKVSDDKLPTYDSSKNKQLSSKEEEELLRLMGKHE